MEKIAPFKSKAQRRWMYAAENRGEVPMGMAEKWEAHTPDKKLPEHVKKSALEKAASPKKHHPDSEAQRKWAFAAEDRGDLPKGKALAWSRRVEGENLPEHSKSAFLNELAEIAS